jgi:hypothetical protein
MNRRVILRAQALALAVVLAGTSTGMPSHHHGDDELTPVLADADHHGHGVQVVEQSDRLRTEIGSVDAVPAMATTGVGIAAVEKVDLLVPSSLPVIGGRAPPPARPRAPPVSD